jgi:predicted dithiol-disulfide oxidoreductase (DUF899 family)
MTAHEVGTAAEHLRARIELLAAEKELTRMNDELARRRRELPWVRVDEDYVFDTEDGEATLIDLFRGRSQLIVYHFMYAPDWDEGCPSCSGLADGFDETHLHLQNHDVAFTAVSRAPLDKLLAYRERMGWSFDWASSADSDFNFDFGHSHTEEEVRPFLEGDLPPAVGQMAELSGTDTAGYLEESPGMSAFALDDGVVYQTYAATNRGLEPAMAYYFLLDRAPLGRQEESGQPHWLRRHDEYAG